MNRIILVYKIIARQIYNRKIKGWSSASKRLAWILFTLNLWALYLSIELIFSTKELGALVTKYSIPWGPSIGALTGLIILIGYLIFPYNFNSKSIALIRKIFQYINKIPKTIIILFIAISVCLFFISLIIYCSLL
jgi:hypothetical protein